MCDEIENRVKDLMDYLIFKLKSENIPVNEFRMQKLIFKIKMELTQSHELYSQLPFYWYLKGPYSEVVSKVFEKQIKNSISAPITKIIEEFPEIEKITNGLTENRDYILNEIDKDIYKEYAPYKFMYSYKYEIYNLAKTAETAEFDVEDYIYKLYLCEARLPCDEYFNRFNEMFSKFTTNLDLINDCNNFESSWNHINETIIEIWKCFVKGLRILFRDEFYEKNENQWKKEYENSLNETKRLIDKSDELIDFKSLPNYKSGEIQKRISDSTIGTYLRR